ncbi:L,D-transpeptidase family protein [Hoeflea sp. TYP-13]|uniref:L,D-transpeptidase family protein n=1 Tax=Hoeflea sp. TYP-13 TaxID=3230023 RepID=UPI0034C635AC
MRKLSSKLLFATALSAAALASSAERGVAVQPLKEGSGKISSILPEERPAEPVLMLVSLDDQTMQVYTGDNLIARSKVSTGKTGHRTPTGIFSVLEKRRYHESNIYSRAPMPYMQRLTWSGIALHESKSVPDYPASHGCVRLPNRFAKQLFGFTGMGAHVLITDEELTPSPIVHRNLIYPGGVPSEDTAYSSSTEPVIKTRIRSKGSSSIIRIVEYTNETDTGSSISAVTIEDNFVLRGSLEDGPPGTAEPDDFVVPESRSPIRILITRRTGQDLVRDIQSMLNQLGHEAGDEDGLIGPETGNAIVAYQKSQGHSPTGTVSVALAQALHSDTRRGEFPIGHIYVRQNFKPVFDAPFVLKNASAPLGTHFLAALSQPGDPDGIRWIRTSLADTTRPSPLLDIDTGYKSSFLAPSGTHAALSRIDLPGQIRKRLTAMLVPGSSLIITDGGFSNESHLGTDFIVLTNSPAND